MTESSNMKVVAKPNKPESSVACNFTRKVLRTLSSFLREGCLQIGLTLTFISSSKIMILIKTISMEFTFKFINLKFQEKREIAGY